MIEIIDKKTQNAMVFTVFAELYKPPTLEIWKDLEQHNLLKDLQNTVNELYGLTFSLEGIMPENYGQLCSIHKEAIGFADEKAIIPVESLYKPWTQDETCTLPFAREKGYLQGDSALHIRFLLEELQIDIPDEYQGTPDHLSILLELAAYFIEHAPDPFTAEFIDDHLNWLADFETELTGKSVHPFYERITGLLIKVIEAQRKF